MYAIIVPPTPYQKGRGVRFEIEVRHDVGQKVGSYSELHKMAQRIKRAAKKWAPDTRLYQTRVLISNKEISHAELQWWIDANWPELKASK